MNKTATNTSDFQRKIRDYWLDKYNCGLQVYESEGSHYMARDDLSEGRFIVVTLLCFHLSILRRPSGFLSTMILI